MDTTWLFVLIPVFFIGMWAGVTLLLSFLSGWRSLAASYRGRLSSTTGYVPMGSAMLTRFFFPVSFSGCLNVGVGAEGVELSVFPLFALGSPPLLIPWSHMAECRSYRLMGLFDRFVFRPAYGGVKITLTGRAARMLAAELAPENPERPAPASA